MANLFKTTDIGNIVELLRQFALAIRQFFATKSELNEVKSSIPTSLPANGGNADYATSAGYTLSLDSISLPSSKTNVANTVWCKFATIKFNETAYCNASGYIFFSGSENADYTGILEYHFRSDASTTVIGVGQLSWLIKSHDYASVIAVKSEDNVYDFYINNYSDWCTQRIYHFSAFNDRFKWNIGSWTTTKPTAAYTASDVGRVYYSTNAGNAATATNVDWSGVTNRPTKVSQFKNDVGYVTTDTTYSTATSDTFGLVKIGYSENGKNYPVRLNNGQMYVNVPWTDTKRDITDSYDGASSDTSLSQKGGKAMYDALVNGYASSAGNAETATKLQTVCTIWGQRFDGTDNVAGVISRVEHINFVGNWMNIGIVYNSSNAVQDLIIQANGGKPLSINPNGGYVGIGTTSPSYKLQVVGDIYTTTGFKKDGSDDSYVLLGGGGHKKESELSVNYAASAGNSDTLDNLHADSFVTKNSEFYFYARGTSPYNYVWLCRIGNKEAYSGLALTLDVNSRFHKHYQINFLINTGELPYSGSFVSINKSDGAPEVYYVRTANGSDVGYDYYDIYVTCGDWNSGGYKIINKNVNGSLSFTNKCIIVDSVPSGAIAVELMYSSVFATKGYVGNGALHIKVNDTELTQEGGVFTANKSGDSTINIPVPTAESIEQSTMNKLGDKVVFKDTFASELAKEMAEVTSKQNPNKVLKLKFTNPEATLECTPNILSFNYIKVDGYYRLNIKCTFIVRGFNFADQKGKRTYNPILYNVLYGSINNSSLSSEKTGIIEFYQSDQQWASTSATGPVMFEISVFVKSLSTDYNDGIYGELYIKQFYS